MTQPLFCSSMYRVHVAVLSVVKFIDLTLMTGFLKQNGSRFTLMNDQEAKCVAIVFILVLY
jgi:hypothetical protein